MGDTGIMGYLLYGGNTLSRPILTLLLSAVLSWRHKMTFCLLSVLGKLYVWVSLKILGRTSVQLEPPSMTNGYTKTE